MPPQVLRFTQNTLSSQSSVRIRHDGTLEDSGAFSSEWGQQHGAGASRGAATSSSRWEMAAQNRWQEQQQQQQEEEKDKEGGEAGEDLLANPLHLPDQRRPVHAGGRQRKQFASRKGGPPPPPPS